MDKCKKCGQCCYITETKPCKYLIEYQDGTTKCRIYKKRIGTIIGRKWLILPIQCGWRKETTNDFKGCPYNTNKPIVKVKE